MEVILARKQIKIELQFSTGLWLLSLDICVDATVHFLIINNPCPYSGSPNIRTVFKTSTKYGI